MQSLLDFKGAKKAGRFDFKSRNLLQNETVILEISKENIKKNDMQLQREILEMIEAPMEQTYYDYPQQLMENKYWRRFSKYVSTVLNPDPKVRYRPLPHRSDHPNHHAADHLPVLQADGRTHLRRV